MRNVIYSTNISIDGNCDHTSSGPDEELYEYFIKLMQDTDLVVYGRKTYELMFPYWSDIAEAQSETKVENEFAETLTAVNKLVFSKTLKSADYNTRIVRENPGDEILKLKQQAGKKILIGSINLGSQFMALGLIDEYFIVIHPVIAGEGTHLLEGITLQEKIKLKLVDVKVFKSGYVGIHYVKQ